MIEVERGQDISPETSWLFKNVFFILYFFATVRVNSEHYNFPKGFCMDYITSLTNTAG